MEQYIEQIKKICEIEDIHISSNIQFKSCKATSYAGRCKHTKSGCIVYINIYLTNEQDIKNTIAHELLHTCPGCRNHGIIWEKYAKRFDKYGYTITRVTDEGIFERNPKLKQANEPKYRISCKHCGFVTYRNRNYNINRYKCPKCGGKLHIESAD